jgi:hypothetical protein
VKSSEAGLRDYYGPRWREALSRWREVLEPIVRDDPGIDIWRLAELVNKTPTVTAQAVADVGTLEWREGGFYLAASASDEQL